MVQQCAAWIYIKTRAGLCPRLLAEAPDKRLRCQRWLLDAGLSSFPGAKG